MGDVRNRQLRWERWLLDTPEAMCTCLRELIGRGWDDSEPEIDIDRGSLRAGLNPDGSPVWLLELGLRAKPLDPVLANMGNVIVRLGTRFESLTREDYLAVYGDAADDTSD